MFLIVKIVETFPETSQKSIIWERSGDVSGNVSTGVVVGRMLLSPVQYLSEIVFRWVFDEFLRAFVVGWSDILHAVVKH